MCSGLHYAGLWRTTLTQWHFLTSALTDQLQCYINQPQKYFPQSTDRWSAWILNLSRHTVWGLLI